MVLEKIKSIFGRGKDKKKKVRIIGIESRYTPKRKEGYASRGKVRILGIEPLNAENEIGKDYTLELEGFTEEGKERWETWKYTRNEEVKMIDIYINGPQNIEIRYKDLVGGDSLPEREPKRAEVRGKYTIIWWGDASGYKETQEIKLEVFGNDKGEIFENYKREALNEIRYTVLKHIDERITSDDIKEAVKNYFK